MVGLRPPKRFCTFVEGAPVDRAIESVLVDFPGGQAITIDRADAALAERLRGIDRNALLHTPMHEILCFLNNVGQNWKLRDYSHRALYERDLRTYLGYSEVMARNEADWIALLLSSTNRLYDTIASELGSWRILDEWIHAEESEVRALPLGVALHIMPGNVPLSALISLLRAIVTKNVSIAKPSATDPFTLQALLRSFRDVDPDHPVTRSVSVAYWPSDDAAVGRGIAAAADLIVAWGGADAIAWARANAGADTAVVEFGPKRSLSIVAEGADLAQAARGAAFDIAAYDQRACFSSREIWVDARIVDAFVPELEAALANIEQVLPPAPMAPDNAADRNLRLLHADLVGATMRKGAGWAIVADDPDSPAAHHCLGRTVFVRRYAMIDAVVATLDGGVQTVGVAPWRHAASLRNALAEAGVSRIVEIGMNNIFRTGGAHDGMYPLQRFVRLVSHEAPSTMFIKGINVKVDQTEFVEHDRLLAFAP